MPYDHGEASSADTAFPFADDTVPPDVTLVGPSEPSLYTKNARSHGAHDDGDHDANDSNTIKSKAVKVESSAADDDSRGGGAPTVLKKHHRTNFQNSLRMRVCLRE